MAQFMAQKLYKSVTDSLDYMTAIHFQFYSILFTTP